MNLSTACSSNRAKEVGLRKVVGAGRAQLISQFLGEALIMSVVASILSILMVQIFLPSLNRLAVKQLTLFPINGLFVFLFIGLVGIVGLLSGCYPALFLTSSNPLRSLRASLVFKSNRSLFRLISVVGQFTISVLLISCTLVVHRQLNFMQNKPLGFNTDLVLKLPLNTGLRQHFESFKNELLNNPNITHITTGQALPYDEDYKTSGLEWDGKDPEMVSNIRYSITDFNYIEAFGMEIVKGRSFSLDFPGDRKNFVINEEAVKYFDMDTPIGQRLRFWGNEGTIIGVVKNFHHVSLHREIMPHVLTISQNYGRWLRFIYVKIRSNNIPDTIKNIEETAKRIAPDYPFEYSFLDQGIGDLYDTEQRLGQIIGYFACVAIFISCLGIFGLSAYTAEQRTKEIGIRKVMGASISDIVFLLSKEFSRWVILAIVLSYPIAWFSMHKWLQHFAYKTPLSWVIFLLAGMLALAIALLTVSYQSLIAARSNPADSLRFE